MKNSELELGNGGFGFDIFEKSENVESDAKATGCSVTGQLVKEAGNGEAVEHGIGVESKGYK